MNRLPTLDYLRGLCSLLILVYHFTLFTLGDPPAESVLKRVGLYGVSVFYVLSGLTLFYVYHQKLQPEKQAVKDFFAKRFFRIYPLMWLVSAAYLFLVQYPGHEVVLLNFTGLFGLLKPWAYLGTGMWSIGNELVFYLLFPVFLFALRYSKWAFAALAASAFAVYLYYAFGMLPGYQSMVQAWRAYINPLNQLFLFLAGIALGLMLPHRLPAWVAPAGLVLAVAGFIFYPVTGDALYLVTGFNRLVFTFFSLVVVLCTLSLKKEPPSWLAGPLRFLGDCSYGLYLLHPLVLVGTLALAKRVAGWFTMPLPLVWLLAGAGSLVLSAVVFRYLERPFIRLGRRLTTVPPKLASGSHG